MLPALAAILIVFYLVLLKAFTPSLSAFFINTILILYIYKKIKKDIHHEGYLGLHLIAILLTSAIFILFGNAQLFTLIVKLQIIELTFFLILTYLISILIKSVYFSLYEKHKIL